MGAVHDHPVAVEARGVERRFRGGRGVGPIDLAVPGGTCLGLMGPNGAGKSTLLRLLATVDRPRAGTLRWLGGEPRPRAVRGRLGLALDSHLDEESLSGRQAAYFWCRQWVAEPARARRLVDAALARFGLAAVADEPIAAYSFGMRRRLGLVEGLAHEPDLALLDEPTAGLDPDGAAVLGAELLRRSEALRTTVVASNHPEFVAQACSVVGFLDGGRLVHLASPADLLAGVGGERVVELTLTGRADCAALRAVPGVVAVRPTAAGAEVRAGGAALAALVAAADRPAGAVVGVRVRSADLRDSFRALTGGSLEEPATRGATAATASGRR